ncbi:MAG: putrescine/ornithine APC transporter [Candidatus Tyloplasma litorale]|nr:MAG: putrescine/ornithine APC transporter [Mycoplasmatales bacterium]
MNKKTQTKQSSREFGLLSMIAMVMGIVIGSGIFAKNAGLVSTNGSIYITFVAWIVGAILVLSIVIAFMELFTMTEKANEQATYANWGRMLINSKFAKFASMYFIFVNLPISIVTLTIFAGNRIVDVLFVDTNLISTTTSYFLIRLLIVVLLLTYFFTINGLYTKPGKYLQNIGTTVKVIPLGFVFILFLIMLMIPGSEINPIFNQDFNQAITNASEVNNDGVNGLLVFASTMPAIIFVFDGFLTSGSLSKEAKSPSTYRYAVLIGIILITFVYLTYSLGVFALGSPFVDASNNAVSWSDYDASQSYTLDSNYGEINNAIISVFGEGAQWFASLITLIVAISIITSVSGITMSCMRGISDMSANNLISDPEGKTLIRNQHNSLPGAMKIVILLCIGYFLIDVSLDAIAIPSGGWETADNYHLTAGSDFFSNLTSVGSFIIMAILLAAGVRNRKTKVADSQKFKFFIPAAITAIITLGLIVIIYVIQIFWFAPPEGDGYDAYVRMYIVQIIVAFIWLLSTPIWYWWLNKRSLKVSDDQYKLKEEIINNYKNA